MSQGILRIGLGLCVLTLLCGVAMSQENLIVNGSFETPLAQSVQWPSYFQNVADVPGWSFTGAGWGHNNNLTGAQEDGQRSPFHGGGRPIPDGNQVLFMQGAGNKTATQTIEGMVEGEVYQIIYYVGIRPGNPGMDLTVTLGNVELLPVTRITTNSGPYSRFEHEVVFDSNVGTPTLTFFSNYEPGGDVTILFDHVQAYLVPFSAEISGPGLVAQGNQVVLTANLAALIGDNPTYQWYLDGVELVGETGATLTLLDVVIEDSGVYSVTVMDGDRVANSAFTLLVVESLPVSNWLTLIALSVLLVLSGAILIRARALRA